MVVADQMDDPGAQVIVAARTAFINAWETTVRFSADIALAARQRSPTRRPLSDADTTHDGQWLSLRLISRSRMVVAAQQ